MFNIFNFHINFLYYLFSFPFVNVIFIRSFIICQKFYNIKQKLNTRRRIIDI
uniref:Uncharacterized protein n=1 Tax=Meloidogyne enterolobii TaxID=390850 RepID=A0A6V7W1D8_MELEN|nr:unnamed protein product [Meloidogyne enterolobii]